MLKGFVGEDQNLITDPVGDRKPVKVLLDWGDVVPGFGVSKDAFWTSWSRLMELAVLCALEEW